MSFERWMIGIGSVLVIVLSGPKGVVLEGQIDSVKVLRGPNPNTDMRS